MMASMPFDFSLVTAPFRMQPGLRRLGPDARQLTPSRPNGRHLREKMAVLGRFADEALVGTPGFDSTPALRCIADEAGRDEPAAFCFESQRQCSAPLLGWSLVDGRIVGDPAGDAAIGAVLAGIDPDWRAAALASLAFEEDFAVVDGSDAANGTLPWLAVCLPSRWSPAEKLGRRFGEVHATVADSAVLVAASDHLVKLVTGAERWERFVWTFSADPRLHQHPSRSDARWPAGASVDALVRQASFRSERQTFLPVPNCRQAVFTIRVESRPVAEAVDSSDAARALHAALASMSVAVLAYRGLTDARSRLLEWLERRSDRAEDRESGPPP